MQITIIKKNRLNIFNLPQNVSGSYWITDFENGKRINLISVEGTSDGWQLVSNHDAFIVDNTDIMVPYVILRPFSFYVLKNNYKNEKYYLYVSPTNDETFKELGVEAGKVVNVGSDKSNDICYNLNGVTKRCYSIEKKDKYFYLTVLDQQSSVYVNQKRVLSTKRIEYGDIIFTFGLKVIPMRKDGTDYLLVNNPNNLLVFNASFVNIIPVKDSFVEDNQVLGDDSLYKDVEYFYRAPHFYRSLDKVSVNVDTPPQKKEDDKTPVALTIGPMITMAMTSVVMLMSTVSNISNGNATVSSSMTSLVMSGAMLASCLLWPILTKAYQKFSDKMYERKRQSLYRKYIDKKESEIEHELGVQKSILLDNYFTVKDCQEVIRGHNVKLWQRRITDADALTLPVGIGSIPMHIDIHYPEEKFTLESDNLLDIAHELGNKERILDDVPITYSFFDNVATGVVGDAITNKEFIDRLILQIMANYSYDEVKLVTLTSTDNESDWDYIKTLPHSWSNDKTLRYFGSCNEDYREIMYVLEKLYNERKNSSNESRNIPHYVIVTDAIKSIDSYDFIKDMMANTNNVGFSIIMLVDKVSALPNECKNFINVSRNDSTIFSSLLNKDTLKFRMDFSPIDDIYNCALELANIPIDIKSEAESSLPDVYEFLEMYQVGKVEQLNSRDRWKKSNPILSLQAPVGIGKNGEIITLDLHEKYHGPHGLIAGTTGSGKSEFIITYILSLAINYHPNEVQIILIDYKGGSLAGAFQNDMYTLPHLAGTITNLDGNELNRSLASIESEIKRRQKEFNDARRIANESSVDIYKYQKLYREGRLEGKEPISHLFIISDEFAELKEQQPEFMEKLISAARVGRSLGVHLILATQKPGGVVDPQIWSNTRFRVCLKVQDTSDSQEVLKKADAAYLKKTGRFYLQVGYDEVFTLGQSAWAGGQYYPNPTFKKDVDASVNFINNIGFVTTTKEEKQVNVVKSLGEELPNIVKYLSDVANQEGVHVRKLWLDKIPDKIYVDSLKSKYNYNSKPFYLDPIIGEYDDPSTQNQNSLNLPLSEFGNALIYGITGSGKETFLTTLLYSCMSSYKPEEVNFYVMDFGGETLRQFEASPYVGDVILVNEEDKIKNLFKMLNGILNERKELFVSYNGNYQSYINSSENKIPNIVVLLNNYEAFIENYEDMSEELNQLSREAFKYGIYFVITASSENSIRIKTRQNFSLVYVLQQNSDTDYSSILGNVRGKLPAKYKGRGLFKKDSIYEFQTAYVTPDDLASFLKVFCNQLRENSNYKAKKVPVLPRVVDYDYVKNDLKVTSNIIVGVNKNKLEIERYNFSKNAINLICSYEVENTINFVNSLVNQVAYMGNYEMMFVNTTENNFSNPNLNGKVFTNNFDKIFSDIETYVNKVFETYEASGFNNDSISSSKRYMCFIYGVNDFINKLNEDNKKKLADLIKKDNQMGLVSFVFVDNPDIIKAFSYEDWFRSGSDTSRGIWIGSGISEQSLLKVAKFDREDREEISNEYGYVVNSSKLFKVKLLTSFEVKEE